jgi:hypothetical protein
MVRPWGPSDLASSEGIRSLPVCADVTSRLVDDRTGDADIDARLSRVTEEQWTELWTVADQIAALREPGVWRGGDVTGRTDDGRPIRQLPYILYARPVSRFMHLWYEMDLIVPHRGVLRERSDELDGVEWVAASPVFDAVRFGTAILRADRFNEGALGRAVEAGAIAAILSRLRVWHSERGQPIRSR